MRLWDFFPIENQLLSVYISRMIRFVFQPIILITLLINGEWQYEQKVFYQLFKNFFSVLLFIRFGECDFFRNCC